MLNYNAIAELVNAATGKKQKISELVLADQAKEMAQKPTELYERMAESFKVMEEAVVTGMNPHLKSTSGLTGGEAHKMKVYREKTKGGLSGTFMTGAISRALAVSGCNAAMGKIVATPTAGSCGILPGCLVSLLDGRRAKKKDLVMAMFTAGAFGLVIANKACLAGAEGGCQAECGSASGMAAAALVEVAGGTPEQAAHACAMAINNQLGLVCDPVAGLVEIPCIKRNVSGVVIAFSAADMALAGITSAIPVDECIEAMSAIGHALPASLRETAGGGLAATPTGIKLRKQVFGK